MSNLNTHSQVLVFRFASMLAQLTVPRNESASTTKRRFFSRHPILKAAHLPKRRYLEVITMLPHLAEKSDWKFHFMVFTECFCSILIIDVYYRVCLCSLSFI